jgi:uncharacterized protein YyaL (SSP411 family)
MKNNLDKDHSPYLQQHKNNPVNWQTWSMEILSLAKKEKKPIILSIGYSSCHWCHVMAHESFEDEETARIMNKNFINIKVDREERPDIDFVFQSSFQLFNQSSGGWPLTMFLDENAIPFMGGTYFPKIEQNGLPSFKSVLLKISEIYSSEREKIIKQAELVNKNLTLKKNAVLSQDLLSILDRLLEKLDKKKGGFIGAPKFPTFNIFDTLLYFYNKTKDEKYLDPVKKIVEKLTSQGIYDHVEGGISRYTVDDEWLVPHFEKMLYDNAQFISLLARYSKIKPSEYLNNKIIQTINFINKNFTNNSNHLLGSAYDADSEGEEGKYYTFTFNEIKDIQNIDKYFDIKKEGNWEGRIILREIEHPPQKLINELLEIRKKKKKPSFDYKTQLDLNCIWINSLIDAHQIMPEKKYLIEAENLFLNLEKTLINKKIFHSNSMTYVFLEDYAYLIDCLLNLYNETLNIRYKILSKNICNEVIDRFYIENKKIFQKNSLETNDLFISPIDIGDHTTQNGNSIMLRNLGKLGFDKEAKELAESLNGYLNVYQTFMASSIKSIDYFNELSSGKKCNDSGCDT